MVFPFANILQPLIDIFEPVLVFFHDDFGLGWGASIVALTVTVRALLVPLTLKQIKSMRKLQQYAPQLKEIQQKYKGDRERTSKETMKFYQENQINPLASCLPLLLQLPVFLGLFYLLREDLRFEICGQTNVPCGDLDKGAHPSAADYVPSDVEFLFVTDLTDKATGGALIALIVLYIGSQLASTMVTAATMDKNQRMIFFALPFLFVAFAINFPAGLLVYWITTNLWTLGQQLVVKKVMPAPKPSEIAAATSGKKKSGGASLEKGDDAKPSGGKKKGEPAAVGSRQKPGAKPPPPPRKRKKRSGRRR